MSEVRHLLKKLEGVLHCLRAYGSAPALLVWRHLVCNPTDDNGRVSELWTETPAGEGEETRGRREMLHTAEVAFRRLR